MPVSSSGGWPALLLNPALPGDTDGDSSVDANDILNVIGDWRPWFAEDPCGPDLDLNG